MRLDKYFKQRPHATEQELRDARFSRLLRIVNNNPKVLREYFGIPPKPETEIDSKRTRGLTPEEEWREKIIIQTISQRYSLDPKTLSPEYDIRSLDKGILDRIEFEMDLEER